MSIEQFNKQVNASYDPEIAYQRWTDYRLQLRQFIEPVIEPGQKILIIGAGTCNDLDLSLFASCDLTLLDIDEEAVKLGTARQGFDGYCLVTSDVTGLSASDFHIEILKAIEGNKMKDFLDGYRQHYGFNLDKQYDLILVLPIYTQLIIPQYLPLVIEKPDALQALMQFTGERIQFLHQILRKHLSDHGQIISISDLMEYPTDHEAAKYLMAHQEDKAILESHFEDYTAHFGLGLGAYGLSELAEEMRVIRSDFFIWPFDDERLFLVKGQVYTK